MPYFAASAEQQTAQVEVNWLLLLVALLPALALGVYIFIKDRVEKEPIGLLLGLLALGAVSCFPAAEVETFLGTIIDNLFVDDQGYVANEFVYTIYKAVTAFIGVALVEELGKWIVMIWLTKKSQHFNSLFDGIVYATFASLGFAAFENVMYAVSYDMETALVRAVTSVPAHMFFGIFMGVYYSFWKISTRAYEIERDMAKDGLINVRKPVCPNSGCVMSLLMPVLVHGFYDFCLFVGSTFWEIVFYIFLVAMYIVCFTRIRRFSKADHGIDNYAYALLSAKYNVVRTGYDGRDEVAVLSDIVESNADKS